MADKIEVPISAEPVTGFRRLGRHEAFVITADLEMIQQIRVIRMNQAGVPLTQVIGENTSLTDARKESMMRTNGDEVVTRNTVGTWVNPRTGAVVAADTKGGIAQSQFFQELTFGQLKAMGFDITDGAKFLQTLYLFLAKQIEAIDKRGDL